jgi:hypothetical protein
MIVRFLCVQGKKEVRRVTARVEDEKAVVLDEVDAPADADITFTVTEPDAQALHDGTLDLSVGFMRGQIKMAGDFGELLHLLPLTWGKKPAVAVSALL